MRLGDLALQAEGREAEGEEGDRGGFGNRERIVRKVRRLITKCRCFGC